MAKNYPGYCPLYLFPFDAALISQNGHPASAEELLEDFLTDPDKKDLCWNFLVGLVERQIEKGYDYNKARASFALFVQKVLNPQPLQFALETWSSREQRPDIEFFHNTTGRRLWRKDIKLDLNGTEDLHNLEGLLDHHGRQIEKLVGLLSATLGEKNAALENLRVSGWHVQALRSRKQIGFRTLLRFHDDLLDPRVSWNTVGVGPTPLKASAQALNDGFAFRLDSRFMNHTSFRHPHNLRNGGLLPKPSQD